MSSFLKVIDSVSEYVGSITRWMVVILVAVTAYDVIARYIFGAPTIWAYQTSTMLGGAVIVLGWAYCQLHNVHTRVDIFYTRLPIRGKAVIDVIGALLLFFPLFAFLIMTSASFMWHAWVDSEIMQETFWYPPAGPFRTVVFLGICLVFLQFIAQFIRDLHTLRKGYNQ